MGIEENKAVVREFVERLAKGDTSVIDELTTSNLVIHQIGIGSDMDREGMKQYNSNARSALDSSPTIKDMLAEGDKVLVFVTTKATHIGKWRNVASTGKNVEFSRMAIHRLEDGKIAESWTLIDRYGLYEQLGAIPPMTELGK
ncbi:ester cyclase [Chloroflexota bacterium]